MSRIEITQNKNWGRIGTPKIFLLLLYVGYVIFGIGLGVMLKNEDEGLPFFIIGLIVLFVSGILFLTLLYQIWRFVINGLKFNGAMPSIKGPGRAIGFLFIPIFSLYWVFKVYGDFSGDFNRLSGMTGSNLTMPEGLGSAIPFLVIAGIVPYINIVAGLLNSLILIPRFISMAAGRCRNLSQGIA